MAKYQTESVEIPGSPLRSWIQGKPVLKEIQRDMTELIAEYIESHPEFHVTPRGHFNVMKNAPFAMTHK